MENKYLNRVHTSGQLELVPLYETEGNPGKSVNGDNTDNNDK